MSLSPRVSANDTRVTHSSVDMATNNERVPTTEDLDAHNQDREWNGSRRPRPISVPSPGRRAHRCVRAARRILCRTQQLQITHNAKDFLHAFCDTTKHRTRNNTLFARGCESHRLAPAHRINCFTHDQATVLARAASPQARRVTHDICSYIQHHERAGGKDPHVGNV